MTNRFINRIMNELRVVTRKYIYEYDWDVTNGYQIIRTPRTGYEHWQIVKVMYK